MVPRNTIGSLNTLVFLLVKFDILTFSLSVISWDSLQIIRINLDILCSLIPLILTEQLLGARNYCKCWDALKKIIETVLVLEVTNYTDV